MQPRKLNSHKGATNYMVGPFLVAVERRTETVRGHGGLRKTTTSTRWHAVRVDGDERHVAGSGGIRTAARILAALESEGGAA